MLTRPPFPLPASRRLELSVLLGPALALFVCFVLAPILVAGYYSLHAWDGFGALEPVGLATTATRCRTTCSRRRSATT